MSVLNEDVSGEPQHTNVVLTLSRVRTYSNLEGSQDFEGSLCSLDSHQSQITNQLSIHTNQLSIQELEIAEKNVKKLLKISRDRWNKLDLGFVQSIVAKWFKNISRKATMIWAILSNIVFSLFDTGTDLAVAITLFSNGEYGYGSVVLLLDYLPGWELLIHNLCSERWRNLKSPKQKIITIAFLIASPFSLPLFFVHWLTVFETANDETFDYLHHNARLSQLLMGSVESPLQVMMLSVLWAEGKISLPWLEGVHYTDSEGNTLDFGIPSLAMSLVVILKGSLEIAECKSIGENLAVCGYAVCNFVFRLGSFALAIIYFKEWSILVFVIIATMNATCIIRYDASKRKVFSIVTSAVVGTFVPFVSSDQPHHYQRVSNGQTQSDAKEKSRKRRNLSSKMALWTTPVIFLSDVVLLCLLKYYPSFKYSEDIILQEETTIRLLTVLIFPVSICAIIAAISFRKDDYSKDIQNVDPKDYFNVNQVMDMFSKRIFKTFHSSFHYFGIALSVFLLLITFPLGIKYIQSYRPNGKYKFESHNIYIFCCDKKSINTFLGPYSIYLFWF